MRAPALLAAALLTVLAAACASTQLDRRFAAGSYADVVRLFEADSALHVQEHALYHVGLAYGAPDSPAYDPGRAIATFDRLLALFPDSQHRQHARQLQQLLGFVQAADDLRAQHDEQVGALAARLDAQQEQLEDLEHRLQQEKTRADALRAIADRLDRDVRARERRIQALEEELTALKEIDLNRPQASGRAPPTSEAVSPRR